MGEAATTISTILFFVAAFFGSGAYSVLSLSDYRAARRGFWGTAISFAALGVVLGIMTNWPLPIRMAIAGGFCLTAAIGMVWISDYLKVRERLGLVEAEVNFAYVGTLSQADNPLGNHLAIVLPHQPKSVLNLRITFQPENDVSRISQFSANILYQEGAPFVPIGKAHTLELSEGNYHVTIQTQDGTFFEFLKLRVDEGKLKRDIQVYKSLPPGQGGTLSPILTIKD